MANIWQMNMWLLWSWGSSLCFCSLLFLNCDLPNDANRGFSLKEKTKQNNKKQKKKTTKKQQQKNKKKKTEKKQKPKKKKKKKKQSMENSVTSRLILTGSALFAKVNIFVCRHERVNILVVQYFSHVHLKLWVFYPIWDEELGQVQP